MSTKEKVVLSVVVVVVAFASGRYLAPTKVVTKTETVEVVKQVDAKTSEADRDKHKATTTTETVQPDGTKTITTTTTEDSVTHKQASDVSSSESTKATEAFKEVIRSSDKVTISALAAFSLNDLKPIYGTSVYKPILGPFGLGVGAIGLTNTTVFVSLGLSL